jgi:hypothetical protein
LKNAEYVISSQVLADVSDDMFGGDDVCGKTLQRLPPSATRDRLTEKCMIFSDFLE